MNKSKSRDTKSNDLKICSLLAITYPFLCNKKFFHNFLLHKKRSTMDTHWRKRKFICSNVLMLHKEEPDHWMKQEAQFLQLQHDHQTLVQWQY